MVTGSQRHGASTDGVTLNTMPSGTHKQDPVSASKLRPSDQKKEPSPGVREGIVRVACIWVDALSARFISPWNRV